MLPYKIDVTKGKRYFWCACGYTQNPPFCDGSHKGKDISPIIYDAEKDKVVYFCGCTKTQNAPLCDGSHKELEQ